MQKQVVGVLAFGLASFVGGCNSLPRPTLTIQPSKSEVALQELAQKQEERIKALNEQIEQLDKKHKNFFDSNISLGTASVWAAIDTLSLDPNKNKFSFAALAALDVAKSALPEPTIADYKRTLETQRKLLSEQEKEIAAGKVEIEKQKGEALAAKAAQEQILAEKATLEKKKEEERVAFEQQKEELQKKAIEEKNLAIAKANKEANEAEAKKKAALEKLVVYCLMGFGLLAGVGAVMIKGPTQMFNPSLGLFAAVCVGLAITVSFLPLWVLITAFGIVFTLAIGAVIKAWKDAEDDADIAAGAIQNFRQEDEKLFKEKLAPKLEDWSKDKPKAKVRTQKRVKKLNQD